MVIVIAEGAGQELLPESILSMNKQDAWKQVTPRCLSVVISEDEGSLCKSEKDDDKSKIHRCVQVQSSTGIHSSFPDAFLATKFFILNGFCYFCICTILCCYFCICTIFCCYNLYRESEYIELARLLYERHRDGCFSYSNYHVFIGLIPDHQSFVICQRTYHASV
ncbi:PREDICTED: uncharacterized protein LOC105111722 [Populus euphratica]|uniref:Uncharacterized protein LOC105111722 n=1 Tax=Populus euphratica TaxID=75702 RepID=A0AAJ6T741_POPEU|nr:PREDICTED: uncharacterized protein LOC105111722 [Populus euphratica]